MTFSRVTDVFVMLVIVAGITTVVAHPESAKIVTAGGKFFTDSLRAAQGR